MALGEAVHGSHAEQQPLCRTGRLIFRLVERCQGCVATAPSCFPGGIAEGAIPALKVSGGNKSFQILSHYSMTEILEAPGGNRYRLPEPARVYVSERAPEGLELLYAQRMIAYFIELLSEKESAYVALTASEEKQNLYRLIEYALHGNVGDASLLPSRAAMLTACGVLDSVRDC